MSNKNTRVDRQILAHLPGCGITYTLANLVKQQIEQLNCLIVIVPDSLMAVRVEQELKKS